MAESDDNQIWKHTRKFVLFNALYTLTLCKAVYVRLKIDFVLNSRFSDGNALSTKPYYAKQMHEFFDYLILPILKAVKRREKFMWDYIF